MWDVIGLPAIHGAAFADPSGRIVAKLETGLGGCGECRRDAGSGIGGRGALAQRSFYFVQPVGALQDLSRLAAVGGADNAIALHHVENAGGAAVA